MHGGGLVMVGSRCVYQHPIFQNLEWGVYYDGGFGNIFKVIILVKPQLLFSADLSPHGEGTGTWGMDTTPPQY